MFLTAISVDIYFENSSLSESTRSSYTVASQQSTCTFPNGISPTHSPRGVRSGKQNQSDSEIDHRHNKNNRRKASSQQSDRVWLDDGVSNQKSPTPRDEGRNQSSKWSSSNNQQSNTKSLSGEYLTESEVRSRNTYYQHVMNSGQPKPLSHPDRHPSNAGYELATEQIDPRSQNKDNGSKVGMVECIV